MELTTQTQEVEEIAEIQKRVTRLADDLEIPQETALQLLQLQQNQKIISQLKEIEVHTNNIVRQSYS